VRRIEFVAKILQPRGEHGKAYLVLQG